VNDQPGYLTFYSTRFCLDALNADFDGYANGTTWNGWACPYFSRDVAEAVLEASTANGYQWLYDGDRDTYVVRSIDDPDGYEPEQFPGQTVEINGKEVKVYPIGAYSWIWEECEE
jgi:hypothetical protein